MLRAATAGTFAVFVGYYSIWLVRPEPIVAPYWHSDHCFIPTAGAWAEIAGSELASIGFADLRAILCFEEDR